MKQIKCVYCGKSNYVKKGYRQTQNRGKIQRFICKECGKQFTNDEGFYRMRNSENKITSAIDLYFSNLSSRKVRNYFRRHIDHNVSHITVLDWCRKYVLKINKFVNTLQPQLSGKIYADDALDIIIKKSEGHPYVLVSMCYIIFDNLEDTDKVINKDIVIRTIPKINNELEKDFFAPMHHPLTPKAKELLCKITNNIQHIDFTFKDAVKWTELNGNYVSPYIQELLRKGIINKPDRGKYQIFHRLFVEYVNRISFCS